MYSRCGCAGAGVGSLAVDGADGGDEAGNIRPLQAEWLLCSHRLVGVLGVHVTCG